MGKVEAGTLYGTLNLLILKTLAREPLHGLAISRHIRDESEEVVEVGEGALYMALHRMERDGLLRSEWGTSDTQRRAKFYELTASGRQHLEREMGRWTAHANAVAAVLGLSGGLAR